MFCRVDYDKVRQKEGTVSGRGGWREDSHMSSVSAMGRIRHGGVRQVTVTRFFPRYLMIFRVSFTGKDILSCKLCVGEGELNYRGSGIFMNPGR